MFLGLWGSYGKNDQVDVQYRLAGRDVRVRRIRPATGRSSRLRSPQP